MQQNIYRLLFSRAFSEFANSMYMIILPLVILDMRGSLADVSFFFAVSKLLSVILLPLLGVFVEQVSRKKLLLSCNFFAFILFGWQFFLYAANDMRLALLTFIAVLLNIAFAASDLATRMIFTEIVPAAELEKYNGTKSVMDNLATFLAPMLGTFLYGIFDAALVVLLIFVLYGTAAIISGFLKVAIPKQEAPQKTQVLKEISSGLQFVKSRKAILAFFILVTALNFFVGPTEEVINPGIIISKYGISKQFFGFTSAFNIVGVILGSLFIVRNKRINLHKNMPRLFILNSAVMILIGGLSLLLYGRSKLIFYGLFLVLYLLVGFITILVNVPLNAYFQARVPLEYQGRFFSLLTLAANLSIPFGTSFTGILADKIGPDVTFILNNACIILIVVFTYRNVKILDTKEAADTF